tara:strand:- start:369 stop:491 length:123 start_codon:yes stop_codon:yes gene_type:complete
MQKLYLKNNLQINLINIYKKVPIWSVLQALIAKMEIIKKR